MNHETNGSEGTQKAQRRTQKHKTAFPKGFALFAGFGFFVLLPFAFGFVIH